MTPRATGFDVRPAGEADIRALFAMRTGVRENHRGPDEWARFGVRPEAVAALLRGGDAAARPGECAGHAAGFGMAHAGEGDVFALFVPPRFEGRGLAGLLPREAERWPARRGVGEAWLLTGGDPGLRAPGFYAARGWREADGQLRFTKRLHRGRVRRGPRPGSRGPTRRPGDRGPTRRDTPG